MNQTEKYLKLGLIGLSNSTKFGSWFHGHVGAEIITNTFFIIESGVTKNVQNSIIKRIEFILNSKSQFFECDNVNSSEASSIEDIENQLEENIHNLSTAGHGVIYGTLALKAINKLNGWLPKEIKSGIIKLQKDAYENDFPNRYFGFKDYQNEIIDLSNIPQFNTPKEAAKYCVLNQKYFENQKIKGTHYFFHANQLHDITHSQALLMLEKLGYENLLQPGLEQLRKQIKLGQSQPPKGTPYIGKTQINPFHVQFWERKVNDEHHNKLAYSISYLIKNLEGINESEVLSNVSGHWELMN